MDIMRLRDILGKRVDSGCIKIELVLQETVLEVADQGRILSFFVDTTKWLQATYGHLGQVATILGSKDL